MRAERMQLAAAVALTAAVWLVVLPRLASKPSVRDASRLFDELGVDPAAVFYTDHPRNWVDAVN